MHKHSHPHLNMSFLVIISTFLILVGCGGKLASHVRPNSQDLLRSSPLKGEALCRSALDEAEVLVVDFPSSQRSNLEIMMREHVIAVQHNCKTLKVLRSCRVDGKYAFKGTLLKEEELRLQTGAEVSANLPYSGFNINAKLEGSLKGQATVDLMMLSIGQQRSALIEVTPDELSGRCQEATHYIYSATLGAFAMTQGEIGEINAATEILMASGAMNSQSQRAFTFKDGNMQDCRSSHTNASQAQNGCGAVLKLYLMPISKVSQKKIEVTSSILTVATKSNTRMHNPSCPLGLTYTQGRCMRLVAKLPECTFNHRQGCAQRCEQGKDGRACYIQGQAHYKGTGQSKNPNQARFYFKTACDLRQTDACFMLGLFARRGIDERVDYTRSLGFFTRGCALGHGQSCFHLARQLTKGQGHAVNDDQAFQAYQQGCAAGYPKACTNLGKFYSTGRGVTPDIERSFWLYRRACDGGSPQGCYNVASRYSKGKGVKRDLKQRIRFYQRACRLGHKKACARLKN